MDVIDKIKNNYWGFIEREPIFSNIKREDVRFSTEKNKEIKSKDADNA